MNSPVDIEKKTIPQLAGLLSVKDWTWVVAAAGVLIGVGFTWGIQTGNEERDQLKSSLEQQKFATAVREGRLDETHRRLERLEDRLFDQAQNSSDAANGEPDPEKVEPLVTSPDGVNEPIEPPVRSMGVGQLNVQLGDVLFLEGIDGSRRLIEVKSILPSAHQMIIFESGFNRTLVAGRTHRMNFDNQACFLMLSQALAGPPAHAVMEFQCS